MPRKKIINEKNSKKKIFRLAITEELIFILKKRFLSCNLEEMEQE
jgi:hypothetical protein